VWQWATHQHWALYGQVVSGVKNHGRFSSRRDRFGLPNGRGRNTGRHLTLLRCQRPENFRLPIGGIGVIGGIGHIRFPRRPRREQLAVANPDFDRGVSLGQSFVWAGMNGGGGGSGRQSGGCDFTLTGQSRHYRHSGFDVNQSGSPFEITREWRSRQSGAGLLGILEDSAKQLAKGLGQFGARDAPGNYQRGLRGEFFRFDGVCHMDSFSSGGVKQAGVK